MSTSRTRFRHGLVLGKFYPPHAGHHLLVRTAAARCELLSVLVLASAVESIPLADRVAWMRQIHPEESIRILGGMDEVPVDYQDPTVWDAHLTVFRTVLATAADQSRPPVDAVFTSEAYGPELARRFGARHVSVDPPRRQVDCSGTAVRRDPVAHWHQLAGPVRAGLARRVVVVGAESTGTTTLTRALAETYRARGGAWAGTRWVPEYGREYTHRKLAELGAATGRPPGLADMADLVWTEADFVTIARRQAALEDELAAVGSPLLLCDTDAFATSRWHERYLGSVSARVEQVAAAGRHHLWLLTDHVGVPFEQDGIRDGERLRPWMTERFRAELTARSLPHLVVTGDPRRRLRSATAAVDRLLARGWGLADPLG